MNNIRKQVMFFVILFLCHTSLGIDTEDVQKLADEISTLTSSTWDIISKLRHVSKHAITFVRVASPIGSLIAAGADIAFKPESEEFKAIQKLHNFVEAKFAALSRHVEHQTNELKFFLTESDYYTSVTRPLNGIQRSYSGITDPFSNRTQYKSDFISRCTDRSSPYDVLMDLKERLYTNCPFPSYEETENYAEAHYMFQQIEKHYHKNFTFSSVEYAAIKQSILSKASWVFVSEELQKIFYSNEQTGEVENEIKNLHRRLYKDENLCWLKTIMEGNHWRREQLFHFAEIVRLDLMKTEISWPIISKRYAIEATGTSPIEEGIDNYNSVALKIKKTLDQMGEERPDERQLASICPEYYCIQLSDINGINAFVVRYEEGQYDKALNAFAWFDESMQLKMQALIE
ncbi:hypothetical protein niasHT_010888 [Heterodera trifolii]|uniref:Uncharacterized protein n=1 Tax=Heterodera trifolii TaxID=157864 RepID=A0ABD2LIG3_9BILA